MVEQELDDEDRQSRFWRRRPDGFTVKEKEHIICIWDFKRVSDAGQEYVTETRLDDDDRQEMGITPGEWE